MPIDRATRAGRPTSPRGEQPSHQGEQRHVDQRIGESGDDDVPEEPASGSNLAMGPESRVTATTAAVRAPSSASRTRVGERRGTCTRLSSPVPPARQRWPTGGVRPGRCGGGPGRAHEEHEDQNPSARKARAAAIHAHRARRRERVTGRATATAAATTYPRTGASRRRARRSRARSGRREWSSPRRPRPGRRGGRSLRHRRARLLNRHRRSCWPGKLHRHHRASCPSCLALVETGGGGGGGRTSDDARPEVAGKLAVRRPPAYRYTRGSRPCRPARRNPGPSVWPPVLPPAPPRSRLASPLCTSVARCCSPANALMTTSAPVNAGTAHCRICS